MPRGFRFPVITFLCESGDGRTGLAGDQEAGRSPEVSGLTVNGFPSAGAGPHVDSFTLIVTPNFTSSAYGIEGRRRPIVVRAESRSVSTPYKNLIIGGSSATCDKNSCDCSNDG